MVMKKEKIKKIAFSLAEAMISMLIISAIATMSIKLFAGQKTKKAADMAHHIMGCYITNEGHVAAMSMDIGEPNTLLIETLDAANHGTVSGPAATKEPGGIGNIKLYINSGGESASSHFNYTPVRIPGDTGRPFCAVDVTETLGSTARTIAMIGGGGFGFMSENANYALYNRPGDSGFFATYTNVDFTRPGIYRFYPGLGATPIGTTPDTQAVGTSENRQGAPSSLVYVPVTRNSTTGVLTETFGSNNSNVETLAEVRGGYSRNHYYPLGAIRISDIGCDDYLSCRFETTEFLLATRKISEVVKSECGGKRTDDCMKKITSNSLNWSRYTSTSNFLSANSYKNYVTKIEPSATGADEPKSYFAGSNGANAFNSYYMGGTMLATAADNQIVIGMNDPNPRCANDMHNYLKITANSGTPTIFTGKNDDPYMYTFGTGGACSNYHNLVAGSNAMAGKGGAVFIIW